MFRNFAISALSMLALSSGAALAENEHKVTDVAFAHEGPFGSFDQMQLQRGLQVYTEVCASCHGLKFVPIRTLSDEGGPHMPADQIRAYAAAFPINDEDSNRQLYDVEKQEFRPLLPSDNFPANQAAEAPDLSLMTKARAGFEGPYGTGINQLFKGIGGPEYVDSILRGYEETPACAPADFPGYYNVAFAKGGIPEECKDEHGHPTIEGSWIAMPPPVSDDIVEYADGTPATAIQVSEDVTSFLTWAAEPKMMARKQTGFIAVLFLGIFAVLLYLTNKRIWAGIKGNRENS